MAATLDPPTAHRPLAPRSPAWGEISLGAVAGGLLVVVGLGLAPARSHDPATARATAAQEDHDGVRVGVRSPQGLREARRRFEAFAAEARLSPPERRRALAALADLQETRTAAVGYFEALEEDDPWLPGTVGLIELGHARELESLIAAAAEARLVGVLGPARAALAEKRLRPLGSFVASAPARP